MSAWPDSPRTKLPGSPPSRKKSPNSNPSPRWSFKRFEHYDYLVFMFKDIRDWLRVLQLLKVAKVDFSISRKSPKSGIGESSNPHAPRHRVSFHWNALLPPWVSWRSIVEEFITDKAALRSGDTSPFKTFVNETLGESWEDQFGAIDDYDFLDARKQDYDFGDP